jgi:hypothetical protein
MVAKKPKDLWAEVGRSGENGFHDDHYLRATKRTLPKVCSLPCLCVSSSCVVG